jgi:hypothetical protein
MVVTHAEDDIWTFVGMSRRARHHERTDDADGAHY